MWLGPIMILRVLNITDFFYIIIYYSFPNIEIFHLGESNPNMNLPNEDEKKEIFQQPQSSQP